MSIVAGWDVVAGAAIGATASMGGFGLQSWLSQRNDRRRRIEEAAARVSAHASHLGTMKAMIDSLARSGAQGPAMDEQAGRLQLEWVATMERLALAVGDIEVLARRKSTVLAAQEAAREAIKPAIGPSDGFTVGVVCALLLEAVRDELGTTAV